MANADLQRAAQMPTREVRKVDRFSLLALGAARQALDGARLDEASKSTCGIIAGNMFAGWTFTEPQLRALHGEGLQAVSPYLATAWFPAAPQGQVTIQLRLQGFAKTVTTDRCAGAHSIGLAYQRIRQGKSDLLLAGGVEAPLTPLVEWSLPDTAKPSPGLREAAAFVLLSSFGGESSRRGGSLAVGGHRNFILTSGIPGSGDRDAGQRLETLLHRNLEQLAAGLERPDLPLRWVFWNLPFGSDGPPRADALIDRVFPRAQAHRALVTEALGETLAASGALAVVAACEALEQEPGPGSALIVSVGHQTCDLLFIDRCD
jgi:hypothetical protein